MKILFQSRLDLFEKGGGDAIQMFETKKALEKLGVEVHIDNSLNVNASSYDIVHVFNLDWVLEPYLQIRNAKRQGKKVVLSPIHHSLEEFERYENENRFGLMRIGNFIIPHQPSRDVARNIVKAVLDPKRIKPTAIQLIMGIRKQQRLSVQLADYVLVQTKLEAFDLKKDYKTGDFEWARVVNGVDLSKFNKGSGIIGKKIAEAERYIMCVGRIEPRKNQLNLIKGYELLKKRRSEYRDLKLIFCGKLNNRHPTYTGAFLKAVGRDTSGIIYKGFTAQEDLAHLFSGTLAHAYPTWFETTGLVSLEAAYAGAKSLIVSGGRVKEYVGDNAVYCDPGSVRSIAKALDKALERPTVQGYFREFVKRNYTWQNCARQTLNVYKKVLN